MSLLPSARPPSLRTRLTQHIVTLILLAIVALFYVLQARPLLFELAAADAARAGREVETHFRNSVASTEGLVTRMAGWGGSGLINEHDVVNFNRLMVEELRQQGALFSSVRIANEAGDELFLLRRTTGWANRVNRGDRPHRQHWTEMAPDMTPLAMRWEDSAYDSRETRWFNTALAAPQDLQIVWTEPYILDARQEAGITAAMRWHDPQTDRLYIVSSGISLHDL